MTSETLAPDIAWEPSGHLSEIALTALADGEEALLDAAMHGHLGSCEACAVRLGEAAMRSAEVADVLSALPSTARAEAPASVVAVPAPVIAVGRSSPVPKAPRRKVPVAAIVGALAVAMLGAAPSVMSLPAEVEQTASVLRKVLPSFVRLLPQAIDRLSSDLRGPGAVLMWGLALALVAAGFGIAKRASKKVVADGGRR